MSTLVYQAISRVAADLASKGVAKSMTNAQDSYRYRSIDELMKRLAPILATHSLCVLPRALERMAIDRASPEGEMLVSVALKVAFDLVSPDDGSSHTVEAYGEALDRSDKATAKAMTAAYKSAMLQVFCIPVAGHEDSDASTLKLKRSGSAVGQPPEPVEGWSQWCTDVHDIIASCETAEALDRLQDTHRPVLRILARQRPDLYTALGEAFASQRQTTNGTATPPTAKQRARRKRSATSRPANRTNGEHATAPIH